nr:MAG: hypothetical protein DIU56_08515 [Pseudomonadota bacterium]
MIVGPASALSTAPQRGSDPIADAASTGCPGAFALALRSAGGSRAPAPLESQTFRDGASDTSGSERTDDGASAPDRSQPHVVSESPSDAQASDMSQGENADAAAYGDRPSPLDAQGNGGDSALAAAQLLFSLQVSPDSGPRPATERDAGTPQSPLPTVGTSARVLEVAWNAAAPGVASDAEFSIDSRMPGTLVEHAVGSESASTVHYGSTLQPNDASGSVHAAGALASGFDSTVAAAERALPRELRHVPGTTAWADELGTQLRWMVREGVETASLRLHPEELGPLEIRIAVRDGQASVWFAAANADTRTALENALPRLRELLASEGLLLGDTGVFREPPRDSARGDAPTPLHAAGDDVHGTNVTGFATSGRGIVDIYA